MQCRNCPGGQLMPGTTTKTFERGPTLLSVREVPADVCDTCGAGMFSGAVTDRLLELLEEAVRELSRGSKDQEVVGGWIERWRATAPRSSSRT